MNVRPSVLRLHSAIYHLVSSLWSRYVEVKRSRFVKAQISNDFSAKIRWKEDRLDSSCLRASSVRKRRWGCILDERRRCRGCTIHILSDEEFQSSLQSGRPCGEYHANRHGMGVLRRLSFQRARRLASTSSPTTSNLNSPPPLRLRAKFRSFSFKESSSLANS
ncbi:hypothetical protein SCHPADRAFT_731394 [Schizopora paradoxa]|uniref:Uncharacterized protein n=1 Tax=Schizopora paradoxa TaxID=27342 RepID=A0A0H2R0G3_9AGAM|nr:hypothetical protein SCHPADRAFT_731394 [Schizopora paradoxa]